MIREALRQGRAFNVIHRVTGYKFDFFPLTSDPFQQSQFERRRCEGSVFVSSAEDTILMKLARACGGVSEWQLNDVRGIVEVQRERLDGEYLRRWAKHVGVEDLLAGFL